VFVLYSPSHTISPSHWYQCPIQDLFCRPVLWFYKRKNNYSFVYLRCLSYYLLCFLFNNMYTHVKINFFKKIALQGVPLWHYHVHIYYIPNWFIHSIFFSFYLSCFLIVISTDLKILFLVFWGTSILFSIMIVLIYIPTSSVWGFLFSTSSLTFVIVCGLGGRHSNSREVESSCGFDLHFLCGQGHWPFFHVFFSHLDFILWKICVEFINSFLHPVIEFLRV
jgi:hypothetical protein